MDVPQRGCILESNPMQDDERPLSHDQNRLERGDESPKILLIAGDASEDLEVMYSIQRLREAGYTVDVASNRKKLLRLAVHDEDPDFDTYVERQGRLCQANVQLDDVAVRDYVALVLPGGRAPEYLRNIPATKQVALEFNTANKPIAHICHGTQILATAGTLKGKKVSSYPEIASDLEAHRATFHDKEVLVDGNLVGARTWADLPAWMREFMKLLSTVAPA